MPDVAEAQNLGHLFDTEESKEEVYQCLLETIKELQRLEASRMEKADSRKDKYARST